MALGFDSNRGARFRTHRARSPACGFRLILVAVLLCGASAVASPPEETMPEEGKSVVLLHGLGRSARNMWILEWRMRRLGYRTCNIDYDTRVSSIDAAVEAVASSVAGCFDRDEPVYFVTHSLGGLVLRALLAGEDPPRVERAVMLAPPNSGSEIADWLQGFEATAGVMGRLAGQLGTGAGDLPKRLPIPQVPFGVIAGDRWINPAGPIFLPGRHDGTVSVASTKLEGMADHLVLPLTHTFIMNSSEVARQTDLFFRTGQFDHTVE